MDIQNKCCGNCKRFENEDIDGFGWCISALAEVGCNYCCPNHEFNNNGWTEITPENVKELYKVFDRLILAHIIPDTVVAAYEKPNETYHTLEQLAELGSYYYYVLPELKIE